MSDTRNSRVLEGFVAYCKANPEQRFWQALRNWSGYDSIVAETPTPEGCMHLDTFCWEGRNENDKGRRTNDRRKEG